MGEKQLSHVDTQQRVDQVHAFKLEIVQLENNGVLAIPLEKLSKVQGYYRQLCSAAIHVVQLEL